MVVHKQNLSRRDFIKATIALIGGLIGVGIGLPSIAYLFLPSFHKTEDESVMDLGPLDKYPIGIPTLFEFTRTKVNGWERTGLNYGVFVLRQAEKDVRVFSDICTHLAYRVSSCQPSNALDKRSRNEQETHADYAHMLSASNRRLCRCIFIQDPSKHSLAGGPGTALSIISFAYDGTDEIRSRKRTASRSLPY